MTARKPAAKRQGRGTKDVGKLEVVPEGITADGFFPLPKLGGKPPLKATREAWEAYWSSSLPQLLTGADRSSLVRLFDQYDRRERLARAWSRSPFTEGSTGQQIVNPAARAVATLDSAIVQLEDRFGITPLARMRLGIAMGEAARSLDEMNREFDEDEDDDDVTTDEDPRRSEAIEAKATPVKKRARKAAAR